MKVHKVKIFGIVLAGIFFILGILTLPNYGINWDTINHLPRGQAYLNYFLTGKTDFSNLPPWKQYWQDPDSLLIKSDIPLNQVPKRSLYQSDATTFNWFMINDGSGHPPLSDILSSFFNKILFQDLRLINDIDSYRVYSIFLASSLIFLLYFWSMKAYKSKIAGIISVISLSTYPLFWSESHFNNEKDIPETVFISWFLFATWKAFTDKRPRWLLLSGIFFGLALGTKFNSVFIPFVVLPWIIYYFLNKRKEFNKNLKKSREFAIKLLLFGISGAVIAIILFVASWPYLWADPLGRTLEVISFYKGIGLTSNIDPTFVGPFKTNTYPIMWIIFTTPIVTLFFASIGLIARKKDSTTLLFVLWLVIPIIRVTMPGTTVYGGIRQIMEYIPALCLLSGFGAYKLSQLLKLKFNGKYHFIFNILVILSFVPIILKLISIHPNENVYFNPLIGGLSGAKEKGIPAWGNTFGAAYRKGISFINKNAERNANVVLVYELLPNIPKIFVRSDLNYHNSMRSGYLQNGEYAITLIRHGTENRSYYDNFLEIFVNPLYEMKVDNTSVLKVWKNSPEFLKTKINFENVKNIKHTKTKEGILIELPETVKLYILKISYSEGKCSALKSGSVEISKDSKTWSRLPGELPNSWRISYLKEQPKDGSFIEPFVGQEAKYIKLLLNPPDTCLTNIKSIVVQKLI